jgi:hypothetical protein
MMELRIIKGAPHIVSKDGRREVIQTPAESIQLARKRIADAKVMLGSLAHSHASETDRLEDALLSGISTAPARKELATIAELIDDQDKEISDTQRDIAQIERLIDEHRAEEIFDSMATAITAATADFDNFLKDHHT